MTAFNPRRVLRSRAALGICFLLPLILLHIGMSGRPALPSIPALSDFNLPRPWSKPDHDPDTQAELAPVHQDGHPTRPDLSRPKDKQRPSDSTNHTYLPNGHLIPNPKAQHPIYDLLKSAQDRWQRKLDSQSKTLREAVDEYRRRYHRAPPKGFDRWWKWAQEKGIPLPDEYDQIVSAVVGMWELALALVRIRSGGELRKALPITHRRRSANASRWNGDMAEAALDRLASASAPLFGP